MRRRKTKTSTERENANDRTARIRRAVTSIDALVGLGGREHDERVRQALHVLRFVAAFLDGAVPPRTPRVYRGALLEAWKRSRAEITSRADECAERIPALWDAMRGDKRGSEKFFARMLVERVRMALAPHHHNGSALTAAERTNLLLVDFPPALGQPSRAEVLIAFERFDGTRTPRLGVEGVARAIAQSTRRRIDEDAIKNAVKQTAKRKPR